MSTQPIEYFGGTPTNPGGYRKPGKSIFQSIVDDFVENSPLDDIAGAIAGGIGFALGQGTGPTASPQAGIVGLENYAANRAAGMSDETASRLADEARTTAYQQQVQSNFGLGAGPLGVAVGSAEAAWSYGVARPASTGALLANPFSPLYQDGAVDQTVGRDQFGRPITETVPTQSGFQLSDVQQAWNRSADVSFGQALATNPLNPVGLATGMNQYDPWSDYDMLQARENPFFNFVSGSYDFGLQVVVPPSVKALRLSAMNKAGLRTTIRSADDLARMRSDYEAHRAANLGDLRDPMPDVMPAQTPYGTGVVEIAEETNLGKIMSHPLVDNSHGVDKLTMGHILQRVDDPDTVNEILLAARGDLTALQRLQEAAPDHVWALADMNSMVRDAWMNGRPFRPEGEDLARVNQIFDSALARDQMFADLRKAFTTEDGFLRGPQSTWMPTKSMTVERVRTAAGKARYAVQSGDYTSAPQWVQRASSGRAGQPTTVFLQWAGSRQPLGTVSNSGARPNDMMIELQAQFDSVPMLRGNREIVIGYEAVDGEMVPQRVTAVELRQMMLQRIADADSDGFLKPAWQEMEDEIVGYMADTLGLDRTRVNQIVAGYRKAMDENISYMHNNGGYLFDEANPTRIIVDPVSRRQMLDSFFTLPLDEIYLAMRGELNTALRVGQTAQAAGINLFDAGMKVFRTNVLFRPGYTGKNSITEPLVSSWLAHGTVLADEGLASVLGNFGRNRVNDLKRFVYLTEMDRLVKKAVKGQPAKTRRQLRAELRALVDQRDATQRGIDDLYALLEDIKAGRVSPTTSADSIAEVRGRLVEGQMRLDAIDAALDGKLPEWRQVVEPASLTELGERLRELRAVTGQDTAYLRQVEQEIADIEDAARQRTVLPSQRAQQRVDRLQARLADVDARLAKLELDYDNPRIDKTDVSVAQKQEDAIARGRDYQATALQRQRTSLQEQLDEAIAEADSTVASNADADTALNYTTAEAARLNQLREVKARISSRTGDMDSQIVESVQELQNLYDEVLETYRVPNQDPTRKIQQLEDTLNALDRKISAVQVKQGEAIKRIERVSGTRGYHGSGDGYTYVYVGGERMAIPGAFSDTAYEFGSAYRSEASAATTNALTYDPSYRATQSMLRWRLAGGPTEVRPTDPTYWDELTWVANAYFRGDKLIQRILEGKPRSEVAAWLASPEGVRYQRSMGKQYLVPKERYSDPVKPTPDIDPSTAKNPKVMKKTRKIGKRAPRVILESTTELDEVYRLVDQYFPDEKVRQTIAAREVTSGELQAAMGGRDDLSRILGEDLEFNAGPVRQVGTWVNNALDKVWQFIATMPEDRVARWPFFAREYRAQMQRRTDILSSQGVRMTNAQFDAMKQSAKRAALVELEKTFYNIRRYSTPVYASRFLMSFPGAFFNSIYRYGRFAVNEPERLFQTALFTGDVIRNMGVDKYGNPVENVQDAEYLLIPGTRRSREDTGLRIPVATLNSVAVGWPGISYLGTMAVSTVLKQKPEAEDALKSFLGPAFDEVFPYGVPRNPLSAGFGSYQKDLWSWAKGSLDMSDEQFIQANVQMYANAVAKWEKNGQQGEAPTFEQAIEDTKAFYISRARDKFISPFGVDRQVPGQLMREAWYELRAMYPDRMEEARQVFMDTYGEWARWYTYSSGDYSAYIPSTQEAYNRVWREFPDLTRDLVSMSADDPSMVSLLTLGTEGAFSPAVNNFLRDNSLPGDDVPVVSRMTPEAFENMVRKNDGWALYLPNKAKYDAERSRLVELRDEAKSREEEARYKAVIANTDASWKQWVASQEDANPAWALDRTDPAGDRAKKTVFYLNTILKDEKFAAGPGKDPIWQKVDQFLVDRQNAKAAISAEKDSDRKDQYKTSFYEYVKSEFIDDDPVFSAFFERYFASEWVDGMEE